MTGEIGNRLVVVGSSGVGKTTLAGVLAERLGVPHIELDELHWGPSWSEAPAEVFRKRTAEAIAGEGWVVDGNYQRFVQDLVWARAQTVVWLDYPFLRTASRLVWRTMRRGVKREELWHGNQEGFRTALFARDSLFVYFARTFRSRRREYENALMDPANAHLRFVRLPSPRATERWLERVPAAPRHERER